MAADALIRDQAGIILLVAPTYRDTLDVPGGEVETEESPHAACRRGVLSPVEIDAITVPEAELDGFALVHPDQISSQVRPVVGRRIRACLLAMAAGSVSALEDGSPLIMRKKQLVEDELL